MTDRTIQGQGRALCAKGLKKNYGSQQVLRDLDLTIEPGHIYGLIGRNGAGKTTLLSILTGQNTKNGGEVTYGGEPVWENPRALGDLCFARELNPSSEVAAAKKPVRYRKYPPPSRSRAVTARNRIRRRIRTKSAPFRVTGDTITRKYEGDWKFFLKFDENGAVRRPSPATPGSGRFVVAMAQATLSWPFGPIHLESA